MRTRADAEIVTQLKNMSRLLYSMTEGLERIDRREFGTHVRDRACTLCNEMRRWDSLSFVRETDCDAVCTYFKYTFTRWRSQFPESQIPLVEALEKQVDIIKGSIEMGLPEAN